ncbi:MAG: hypothetical protein MGU50_22670, partial [Trichodesmium sp. MAG_R02]|nr:hypothetical protein [Trichodesmium sp. MAG_R02]
GLKIVQVPLGISPEIGSIVKYNPHYSTFQIDEPHRHNQNLVGTLHKGVPTVVDRHEKCCKEKS